MFITILLYALFLGAVYKYTIIVGLKVDFKLSALRDIRNAKPFFTTLMKVNSYNLREAINLVSYKYFKDLVLTLVEAKKLYGAPIDKALNEIKKSLGKDMHFERKVLSSFIGGIYQMAIISFVGVLFILMSCYQLDISFPFFVTSMSLGINALGFFVYSFTVFFLKKRSFDFFESLIKNCYILRAYLRCQMPVVHALNKVGIDTLNVHKSELYIKERIENMIQKIKTQGFLDFSEFDMQIDEIWLLMEFQFEKFQKHLNALKLGIIVVFFLSTYLYIIYSFIESINI